MTIKKYFASADTTISNAFDQSLLSANTATGSNMGQADILETFQVYGQVSSSSGLSSELSRILVRFDTTAIASDRSAGTIPASSNVSFYLKLYNAAHPDTIPENYTMAVQAVSQSWQEGFGLDMINYTDKTYGLTGSTWSYRGTTGAWAVAGGKYHQTPIYDVTMTTGLENINLDVTTLVEQWLAGTKDNDGFGISLSSSYEQETKSYYTKKFFARGSEFYFKRPVLEARWDNTVQDDRKSFFLSSSLAPAEDNLNTIYLYNNVRGRLRNIPSIGTDSIYVSIYSGSSDNTVPDAGPLDMVADASHVVAARPKVITGSYVSTGVYAATFAFTGSSTLTKIYDVWFSGSENVTSADGAGVVQLHTGTIDINTLSADIYNPSTRYILSLSNLRESYGPTETARFKLYARPRDWSPTIYTKASNVPETTIITSASYEIFRATDGLKVIPFGTGSDYHTGLSYNVSGNYFDLDLSNLEKDYTYGIRFSFYDDAVASWNTQPYEFNFKVRNDEY